MSESVPADELGVRELCYDDACIGVLDAEGHCNVCHLGPDWHGAIAADFPNEAPSGVDLLHRSLCPDGACVGLIGPDGQCKECGKVGPSVRSDPRLRGMKNEASAPPEPKGAPPEQSTEPEPEGQFELSSPSSDSSNFEDRKLCSDGACIGLIGPDGVCAECGIQ